MNIELDEQECIICMDTKEKEWLTLDCRHTYHKPCIYKWMRVRMSCPVCVRDISPSHNEDTQLLVHLSEDENDTLYECQQRASHMVCALIIAAIVCIIIGSILMVYG